MSCRIADCTNSVLSKKNKLCRAHYKKFMKYGDPEHVALRSSGPEARFWANVRKFRSGDCWTWEGAAGKAGRYGVLKVNGLQVYAHRFSFELHHGPMPGGMFVDHVCHNTLCVNPDHLRLATQAENQRNLKGANTLSRSGVRGVTLTREGRWRAYVTHNRRVHTALFCNLEDARGWAGAKRNELFGEFAGLD